MALLTMPRGISETGMDQGALVTWMRNVQTLLNEVVGDRSAMDGLDVNVKALLNQMRKNALYNVFGNPGFAIDTNFDVKNATAVYYTNGGTLKTLGANTNFDTGTAKTVTASLFNAAILSVNSSGTGVVTWASAAGYASEALAIAALPACAATETAIGYFTIQAHASGFTAGTDALATGSGGNVAAATTYYNSINANATQIGAALSDTLATMSETGTLALA